VPPPAKVSSSRRSGSRWRWERSTESTDLLLVGDEVASIDGQAIPVGISAAQGRLKRMVQNLGTDERFVEVTVRRKSTWGLAQLSHVKLRSEVPHDPDSDEGSGEESEWVMLSDKEAANAGARGSSGQAGMRSLVMNPHELLFDLSEKWLDAFDPTYKKN